MFTQRTKSFILRDILIKLMIEATEDEAIYVFTRINDFEIIYLYDRPACEFIKQEKCNCYKTTLKKLYLCLMISSHPNVQRESLIIYSNRIIRRLTITTAARLLAISEAEYQNLETGIVTNFDLEKIAIIMNFKKEEFYYNYKTILEKIY